MALGKSGRDQAGGNAPAGSGLPDVVNTAFEVIKQPGPNMAQVSGSLGNPMFYIPMNEELQKSYLIVPTNQGQRAAIASRQSMMFGPKDSPSRSQKSEGYTTPLQTFASNNTWETPSGQNTAGARRHQPSTKFVSPSAPIATKMPWDL